MIVRNNIELTARYYGTKAITAVYRGAHLIWEAVNSCFGSGYWIKEKAWSNTDSWRIN
jgi:nitric oxide synthase oxygenase domain/subunit